MSFFFFKVQAGFLIFVGNVVFVTTEQNEIDPNRLVQAYSLLLPLFILVIDGLLFYGINEVRNNRKRPNIFKNYKRDYFPAEEVLHASMDNFGRLRISSCYRCQCVVYNNCIGFVYHWFIRYRYVNEHRS